MEYFLPLKLIYIYIHIYGFRKERGTRDCLAFLTTDISTSLEMKEQTVAAFLGVNGAYDNVFIDVLCGVIRNYLRDQLCALSFITCLNLVWIDS
jgi:hypothetical protein